MNIIGQLCILKNKSEKELLEGYTSKVEFTADFKRKVLDALHTEKCCKVTTQSEKFTNILSDVEDITKETLLERVFNILKTERILPRDMSPILEACGSEEDFLIGMLFLKGIQCNGIVDSRYLIQYRYLDRKQNVPKLAHVGYGVEESTEELSNNISTTSSEVKEVDLNEVFPKQESDDSENKEVEFPILHNKETEEYSPKVSEDMFSDNIICDMFGIDKENETVNEVIKDTAEESAYESQEQEKQQTELDKEAIEEESIVSKEPESKEQVEEEPVDEEKQEEHDIVEEKKEENDIVEESVAETMEDKQEEKDEHEVQETVEEQDKQEEQEVQETVEEQDEHVQEVQETVEEQDEQEQDTDKTVEQEQEQEFLTDKAIESVIDMSTEENVQEENDANEQTELVDELEEKEVEEKPEDAGSPIQENTASILQSESTSIFSRFIN